MDILPPQAVTCFLGMNKRIHEVCLCVYIHMTVMYIIPL